MKTHSKWAVGIALAVAAAAASSAPVIDQQQSDRSEYMAGFSQPGLAQSFTAVADNIVGAGLFLGPGQSGTAAVTLSLWSSLPGGGGAQLASATGTGQAGTWFDVFFDEVAVTAGSTYYLVFSAPSPGLGVMGSLSNPYAGGQTYANDGYQPFADFDYAFRTYTDSGASGGQLPVPATLPLLALGLAGLALVRRRSGA